MLFDPMLVEITSTIIPTKRKVFSLICCAWSVWDPKKGFQSFIIYNKI